MIAFTQTLSTWGGNYYVSKGLGFIYNDHFRGGRGGTGFGAMLPLMRSSSTSVPTLVFEPTPGDTGRYGIPGFQPRIAVGCAGNAWIPASVYDIILNVVDGGHDGAASDRGAAAAHRRRPRRPVERADRGSLSADRFWRTSSRAAIPSLRWAARAR